MPKYSFNQVTKTQDDVAVEQLSGEDLWKAKLLACKIINKQTQQVFSSFDIDKGRSMVDYFSQRTPDEYRKLIYDACKILNEHPTNAHLFQLFGEFTSERFDKHMAFKDGHDYVVTIDGEEIDRQTPTKGQVWYHSNRDIEYQRFWEKMGMDCYNCLFDTIERVEKLIAVNKTKEAEQMYG